MQDLKALKRKYHEAKSELLETRTRLADLQNKQTEFYNRLPALERKRDEAAKVKRGVMERYVLGQASEEELERVRSALSAAETGHKESSEMLDAYTRGIKALEAEEAALVQRLRGAEHEYWYTLSESLAEKAAAAAREVFLDAHAAKSLAGGGSFNDFVAHVFGTSVDEMQRRRQKLTEGHGIGD